MFESDDFDNVLSQLDYSDAVYSHQNNLPTQSSRDSDVIESSVQATEGKAEALNVSRHTALQTKTSLPQEKENCFVNSQKNYSNQENKFFDPTNHSTSLLNHNRNVLVDNCDEYDSIETTDNHLLNVNVQRPESSKNSKKRLLGNLFDHQNKRKFPGPAGLLTHTRSPCQDGDLSSMEISSQDVNGSQEPLHNSAFELPLWTRLQQDLRSHGIQRIDSISYIKEQELNRRLPNRKAHVVTAFVEAIDRSVDDPLVILRDSSGAIKCTLHRDAWSAFSTCLISEYTAVALWKPTVLTTGSTFKKHYLNITLANIIAIYYLRCNSQEDIDLPSGYLKEETDDYVAIRKEPLFSEDNQLKSTTANEDIHQSSNLLDGLDSVLFFDDVF